MTSTAPPARHPGDGWVQCSCGRRHWGLGGAAGLFLVRLDRAAAGSGGDPLAGADLLLQHRALWSDQGGTWGVPGGAVADGEDPSDGGLREANEEAGVSPDDIDVVGSLVLEHRDWRYTTLLGVLRTQSGFVPRATDPESIEVSWVPLGAVPTLPLLRAFEMQLPLYRAALRRALQRRRMRDSRPVTRSADRRCACEHLPGR